MSFSAAIEHCYMPPEQLPLTLQAMFAKGVCAVFSDEQFTAAIPATNDETNELADLFEAAALDLENGGEALTRYYAMRDRLCQPQGYQILSTVFLQEMEKAKHIEETNEFVEKRHSLATAARPKAYSLVQEKALREFNRAQRLRRLGPKRALLYRLAVCRRFKKTMVLSEAEQQLYLSMLSPWKRFWTELIWGGLFVVRMRTGPHREF